MKCYKNIIVIICFFVFAAISGKAWGQSSLTVYDDVNEDPYVPIYGAYCDAYLKCEFVIPASSLSAMSGKDITSMKFYLESPAAASWGAANFQVFLKEVGTTTISAYSGTTGATIVYEGSLDGTQSEMQINFSTNYSYSGGNLLVGVYNTVKGTYKPSSFKGKSISENICIQGYSTSSIDNISVSQRMIYPKTTFFYEEPSSCPKPTNLSVSGVSSSGATVSWTAGGSETKWALKYGTAGFNVETEGTLVANLTSTSYPLTTLSASTEYDVYVKAVCGVGDESGWKKITFTTPCAAASIPYTETFESVTVDDIPNCWERIESYISYPCVKTYSGHNSSSKHLYMYANSSNPNTIALPPMDNINTLEISFWAKYGEIQVGYIKNGVFTSLQTITLSSNYEEKTVSLSGAPADAEMIAFKSEYSGSVYIDDINVSRSCTHRTGTFEFTAASGSILTSNTLDLARTPSPYLNNTLSPSGTVEWGSSNTSVATVSSSGLVTGVNGGSAVITATIPQQTISGTDYCAESAEFTINVSCTQPTVSFPDAPYSYTRSASVSPFMPIVNYNGGSSLPAGTTYSSNNTSIATVNSSGLLTVNTSNVGNATITVTIPSSGTYCSKTVTYGVSVTCNEPTVSLASASYAYMQGESVAPFTPAITYNGGSLPAGTAYSSSNSSLASVNSSGLLTVNTSSNGSATITINIPASGSYCGKVVTYTVAVSDGCPQVGNESNTLNGDYAPIYTLSTGKYSYTQQLYLASEIAASGGASGILESLKFQCYGGASDLNVPIEIYIGQTSRTSLSSEWISDASLQLVYSGTPTFSSGWVDIDVSGANYVWDGTSNILIAVKTLAKPDVNCKFYYTASSGKVRYEYDTSAELELDDANVPSDALLNGYSNGNRTNVKFCLNSCDMRASSLSFETISFMIEYGDAFAGQTATYTGEYPGTITYSSSDPSIATVDENTGVVTMGSTFGTTEIIATDHLDGYCDITARYTIRYKCKVPTLLLDHTSETLRPGNELDISVIANTSGGAVTWSSSNTSVASVNSSGHVTAGILSEGYCTIYATVAGIGNYCSEMAFCNIHVSGDDCARVGWGNGTGIGVYTGNAKSYTQQLYSATEIQMAGGSSGKIGSIKVHTAGSGVTTTSTIYMAITSADELSSGWVSSGLTPVYTGTISYDEEWKEITLATPFEWDGASNIVVAFLNNGSGSDCYVHDIGRTSHTSCKYRYYGSSSDIELNSSNVPNNAGTPSPNVPGNTGIRTNIKFCITPCTHPVDTYFSQSEVSLILNESIDITSLLTITSTEGSVTYTSSNPAVATVSSSGEVTASASNEGTAVISVHVSQTDGGNCPADASIAVKVCNCGASGDVQYQIGTSSNSDYQYAVPTDINYKYGYRQIIYSRDQLVAGKIKSIAFNYKTNSEQTREQVKIYMGHIASSSFASTNYITSGLTEVYSGSITFVQGWNNITLTVPFDYNGCENLIVTIDDNSGTWSSGNFYFYSSTSSNYCMLYYNTDSNADNPTIGSRIQSLPNTKFCIKEEGGSVHTLTYELTGNCTGSVTPVSISSITATEATVTSTIPHCANYAGFLEWNTAANGGGTSYHAGDQIKLCDDVTLYAIYADVVNGESSCANAVAFCNSNSISFAVEEGIGEVYGEFCTYFETPATWWYMQIAEPGDLYMTIHSSAGDVDMACWGPFDNKTCDLADLADNSSVSGWYYYGSDRDSARYHYSNTDATPRFSLESPICNTKTLARPCGKLVDFGGSTSRDEYLQIVDAQRGDYYMVLVANYANNAGTITFTQTGGAGRASCDIVTNCDITNVSANPECTSNTSYDVTGEISFRDAPIDGTLTVSLGGSTLTFIPPFASPIEYSFRGLTPTTTPETMTITATFASSTVNCSKVSSFMSLTKEFCYVVPLPVTLTTLRGECNGKRAIIAWTTASERNNDYFVVERSDDAVNFVEVGRVAGAGNSIEMLSYNYADYSIRTGENYYRLTQVDYDGSRTTSEIIEVHCSGNVPLGDPDVYVYPNPFGDELTVHLVNFGDVAAHIQVYDMLGRMLFERTADDTEVVLQLGALPDAAYTVRVSTADFVVNKKVVKNK